MHKPTQYFGMAILALTLTSCATTTQMTSGADYLSRYKPHTAIAAANTIALNTTNGTAANIDAQVRAIAAIEPDLHFPARIGLARIERGRLTNGPATEMQAWEGLADTLGAPYGQFVPVSPFIAEMVRPKATEKNGYTIPNVIADIRRASARQHLDYVLAYEVSQNESDNSNGLSFTNLTVLGMFVIPSRNVKIKSAASAILIDVRNGYPYGTATAFATDKQARTILSSGNSREKARARNHLLAVENLTGEVETMMKELWVLQHNQ